MGTSWAEVRSTRLGILDQLDLPYGDPGPDARRLMGTLSLVVPDSDEVRGVRKLPIAWLQAYPLFADRSLGVVAGKFAELGERIIAASSVPTYMLYPCRLDGIPGLYARDFFERSTYRRKLIRLGLQIHRSPFATFTGGGRFVSMDGEDFVPRFAILGGGDDDLQHAEFFRAAMIPFTIAAHRFGVADSPEVSNLVRLCSGLTALGAARPEVAIASLREHLLDG